jgi:hypothetical protein
MPRRHTTPRATSQRHAAQLSLLNNAPQVKVFCFFFSKKKKNPLF